MKQITLNLLKNRMEELGNGFEKGYCYDKEALEYAILKYFVNYFKHCDEISQYWNYNVEDINGDFEEYLIDNPNTACSDLSQVSRIQEIIEMITKDMNDKQIQRVWLNNECFEIGDLRDKIKLLWDNIVEHDDEKYDRFRRTFFNLFIK